MRNVLFVTLSAMMFCMPRCFAAELPDMKTIREIAASLKKMWEEDLRNKSLSPPPAEEITKSIDSLKSLPQIGDNSVVRLFLAQYAAFSSSSVEEIFRLFQETVTPANIHEYPDILYPHLEAAGGWYRSEVWAMNNIVFPLKAESRLSFYDEIEWGEYDPYPCEEPDFEPPLALVFSRLGLYDLAWRVQLEEGKKRIYDHPKARSYYLRAADNAYRAGKKELAWSFLMNAAVLEDKIFFEPAMQTAQLWINIEAGTATLPEAEIAVGEERKTLCQEIVERYQNMNAHPRAWLFIQENRDEFDDAEAEIKKVQDDWLELIEGITQPDLAEKIVMYGVQLYPDGADPLSVSIPWAFTEGGLEKLKTDIGELAEQCAEEEKDGFRTWNRAYPSEAFKAKYISCDGKVVTLEKPDGKRITFQFNALHELDQNYVRRRMGIEKLTSFRKVTISGLLTGKFQVKIQPAAE